MKFSLTTSVRKLQVELDDAVTTNSLAVSVGFRQQYGHGLPDVWSHQNTEVSTTTITDILDPTPSQMPRKIEFINLYNRDTADHTVTLYYYHDGTRYIIWKGEIKAGYTFNNGSGVTSTDGSVLWGGGAAATGTVVTENVVFLNHFRESDANTSTWDEKPRATWSLINGAQVDTAQFKFGSGSLYRTGATNVNSTVTISPTFAKTSDFTLSCWIRASSGAQPKVRMFTSAGDTNMYFKRINTSTVRFFWIPDSGSGLSDTNFTCSWPDDTWVHCAVVGDLTNNLFRLYINGTRIDERSITGNLERNTDNVIFHDENTANACWFDECCLTSSVLYTGGTITVPTAEFEIDHTYKRIWSGNTNDDDILIGGATNDWGNMPVDNAIYKYGGGSLDGNGTTRTCDNGFTTLVDRAREWTIQGWARTATNAEFNLVDTGSGFVIAVKPSTSTGSLLVHDGSSFFINTSFSHSCADTVFFHFALCYHPTNGYKLYVNGTLAVNSALTNVIRSTVGQFQFYGTGFTEVWLDDFAVCQHSEYSGLTITPPGELS